MKLSVVIVSYNVKHYLIQCLDSLQRALDGVDAEIFVVDNHSKDGTADTIARKFSTIKADGKQSQQRFRKGKQHSVKAGHGRIRTAAQP